MKSRLIKIDLLLGRIIYLRFEVQVIYDWSKRHLTHRSIWESVTGLFIQVLNIITVGLIRCSINLVCTFDFIMLKSMLLLCLCKIFNWRRRFLLWKISRWRRGSTWGGFRLPIRINLMRQFMSLVLSASICATSTTIWITRSLYSWSWSCHYLSLIRSSPVRHKSWNILLCWL